MLTTLLLLAQASNVETFKVGTLDRQAIVVRPSASTKNAPLVFVFHGHGGNMRQSQRSFSMESRWPEAMVVYPQGMPTKGMTDPEGKKNGWQQKKGDYDDRDLAFFDTMLKKFKATDHIDAKRVYVTGHSNGGRMTYLLWAERGDQLAAVAPSASPAVLNITSAEKIPAFIVAGEQDTIVPFEWQTRSIEAVRKMLGTDKSKAKKDGFTTLEPGPNGLELGTYIFPGGHQAPQPAIDQIAAFFKRHRSQ